MGTKGPRAAASEERRRPVLWALDQVEQRLPAVTQAASRYLVRTGYLLVNRSMRTLPRVCLNYGWAALDGDGLAADSALPPVDRDGLDRLSLQLYEQVCAGQVADKDVLEVGCGRGGGAEMTARVLDARSVTAVDLTASSIKWCTRRWANSGVRFQVGDAQNLPLGDGSFDVVLNVESSHTYPHCEQFLAEAFRVLRPQGQLLLADLRIGWKMPILRQQILDAGFVIEEEHDITANVVRALEIDSPARQEWVDAHVLRPMRQAAYEFAGMAGTGLFAGLSRHEWEYHRFLARKP
jgi:2-polyprenyl-3-methyl-5-hydroxy-6-metoxy-1,4-benzoquinol methylase